MFSSGFRVKIENTFSLSRCDTPLPYTGQGNSLSPPSYAYPRQRNGFSASIVAAKLSVSPLNYTRAITNSILCMLSASIHITVSISADRQSKTCLLSLIYSSLMPSGVILMLFQIDHGFRDCFKSSGTLCDQSLNSALRISRYHSFPFVTASTFPPYFFI